jgi:hypothetical protein
VTKRIGAGEKVKVRRVYISPEPEYLDAAGLEQHFGIAHGLAYDLLKSGAIKAVSLKRNEHQTRAKRLFDCSSVRNFLKSRFDNGVAFAK